MDLGSLASSPRSLASIPLRFVVIKVALGQVSFFSVPLSHSTMLHTRLRVRNNIIIRTNGRSAVMDIGEALEGEVQCTVCWRGCGRMSCDGDSACKGLGLRYLERQSAGGQSDLNFKCCRRC